MRFRSQIPSLHNELYLASTEIRVKKLGSCVICSPSSAWLGFYSREKIYGSCAFLGSHFLDHLFALLPRAF
jgi:hypothetical protein